MYSMIICIKETLIFNYINNKQELSNKSTNILIKKHPNKSMLGGWGTLEENIKK